MRALYELLAEQVQTGRWWPADTRFEIFIGAILTQNTQWTRVEKTIIDMQAAELCDPHAIINATLDELREVIRPAGYFNAKSRYLKAISQWYLDNDDHAAAISTGDLRESLLSVHGVGSETADDILLYAYKRGVFIYDAYGRRLLDAAGFGSFDTYDKAKKALDPLVEQAGFTVEELAEFHGLIVDSGKHARRLGGWPRAYQLLRDQTFAEAIAEKES